MSSKKPQSQSEQVVWLFRFGLEQESGDKMAASVAEELLDYIVGWAEERDLQIGGGYRAPKAGEG